MAKTKSDQRREAALLAVMESNTLTEAAQRAGIGRTTLWEYMHDRDFVRALQSMREARALAREAEAMTARSEALDTLREIMKDADAPHAARISAAKAIITDAAETIKEANAATDKIIARYTFETMDMSV